MNEGIQQLERYRKAKDALEEQEQRGRAYMEKVKADVEQDLAPLREEVEESRRSLEAFVREENGGEKFKCPGLGTAYLTRKRQTKIVDEDAFEEAIRADLDPDDVDALFDHRLNLSRAKKAAEELIEQTGEIAPGVESEEVETLNVRLGK